MGIRPDTLSFAKALTSGYIPLGGVSVDEPLYEAMRDAEPKDRHVRARHHLFRASGRLRRRPEDHRDLQARAHRRGRRARRRRSSRRGWRSLAEHAIVGEARGIGLIGGLEIVADKASRRQYEPKAGVAAKCVAFAQDEGLIVRFLMGDRIAVCPPLIIAPDEIDALFDRLTRALDRTAAWIAAEGLEAMPALRA